MKRTWVVVLLAVASAIPAVAFAQGADVAPVPAWCGGSYGAEGTNFGECVQVQGAPQVAGEASGVRGQNVRVPSVPEYPSSSVTFENGKAYFNKKELNLNFVAGPDRTGELQVGGGEE